LTGLPALQGVFFPLLLNLGLALGMACVRLRQPWRASSRYTTDGLTGWPSRCAQAARIGETTTRLPVAALSSQGFRNSPSSSGVSRACRRPPQLRAGLGNADLFLRKVAWSRATVPRPTPRTVAVCSRVAPNKAGS